MTCRNNLVYLSYKLQIGLVYTMIDMIEKVNLVDEAYVRIRENILSGVWSEGEKIPSENQLCKMLNVSRVVVREALQRMRSERMIVTRQGSGSFVANPRNFSGYENDSHPIGDLSANYQAFEDIMDFRACLEYSAIKRAVTLASDEELSKIAKIAEDMERSMNDLTAFTQEDYRFHLEILACAKNPLYLHAMESCKESVESCLTAMNKLNGGREWAVQLHHEIAKCLCARDAKKAISLLKGNGEYNAARLAEFCPDIIK